MNGLADYWPTMANIQDCIRTEAETTDEAVLLAVHEPVPLRFRQSGSGEEVARTEQELLQALMVPASKTGGSAVVVAVTGASGVGKSHMIRWLHAQLKRHEAYDRLVIVLIPKTASLRKVVELMLEPLHGEAYDRLRHELDSVTATLTQEQAGALLGAALASELKKCSAVWTAELRAHGATTTPALPQRLHHANHLYFLLNDGVVKDGWFGRVLERIVAQVCHGGSEAGTGELRRFVPDDFVEPERFDSTQATQPVQRYLLTLSKNDGEGRDLAAQVLQDVLDPALRTIFRFSEALGQRSIEDIVLDIRARLLKEDRELVLLIEDFAALAGIQQPLLNLMIAESHHSGRQIRAQLRTALAVTDGFLPSRQTILTRAGGEWIIPSDSRDDADIVRHLTAMTGRYLNAARWGLANLQRLFDARDLESDDHNLYAWVTEFSSELSDEDTAALKAFGFTPYDHPLFPFNEQAIISFCRRELTVGGRLMFNPREFINRVLRDILLRRDEFEANQFPDATFKKAILATQTDLDLKQQLHPESIRMRLATVLVYWASNPQSLATNSFSVPKEIFITFGLPYPFIETVTPIKPKSPTPETGRQRGDDKTGTPTAVVSQPVAINSGLEQELQEWAEGQQLSQKTARELRKLLIYAAEQRIDWDGLGLQRLPLKAETIWIPYAKSGNPTGEPIFRVWKEELPVPAHVRAGLLALDRWSANDKCWDYPQSEEDYAAVQFLLDHLQPQIERRALDLADKALPVVLQTLHRQSLLLGIGRAADPGEPRLSEWLDMGEDVFSRWSTLEQNSTSNEAREFARFLNGTQTGRDQLQSLLRDYSGCFQGTGSSLHAVCMPRIQRAWSQSNIEQSFIQISDKYPFAREAVTTFSQSRLNKQLDRLSGFARPAVRTLKEAFDENCTVAQTRKTVERLLEEAARHSVTPPNLPTTVRRFLNDMVHDRFAILIGRVHRFEEPTADSPINVRLVAWASLDLPVLMQMACATNQLNESLKDIEHEVDAALCTSGGADVADPLKELIDLLDIGTPTCK